MKKLAILLLFPSLAFAQVQVQGKPGGAIQIGGNQPGVSSIQGATGDFTFTGTGFGGCTTSGGVTTCDFSGGAGITSVNSQTGPALTLQSSGGTIAITNPSANLINFETAGGAQCYLGLGGLVGTFTDVSGVIQGTPLCIGNGPVSFTTPSGATQLQLGIDDDKFVDNTGSFTINIQKNGGSATPVTVNGTSMPWDITSNAGFSYGINDGTSPTIAISGLSAGDTVTVTRASGTVNMGPGTATVDANGWLTVPPGAAGQGGPTGSAISTFTSTNWPTKYMGTTNSSVVTSINGSSGAFTFSGAGVSCSGVTCTFSGGGGGTPAGSPGALQYNNSGAFGGDGSTDGAGNFTMKSLSTTGTAGAGGLIKAVEGTAPSTSAGYDILYADSTAHCFKQSLNGGSFACLGTGSGSLNVNGSPVSSPNLQDSATVTFGVSGSNISATAAGGGGTPAGVNGNPQINASSSFGADTNVIVAQATDTISSIEAACSPCLYQVNIPQTFTLASSHALSSNVTVQFGSGGVWTINGTGFTLSNVQVSPASTISKHFNDVDTGTGTGGLAFAKTQTEDWIDWFGAVPDAQCSGSTVVNSGTDNYPFMQAAINSLTAGKVRSQSGCYRYTSGTPTINKSNIILQGTAVGGQTNQTMWMAGTSTLGNVKFAGVSTSSTIDWDGIDSMTFLRGTAPSTTPGQATGIDLEYTVGFSLTNYHVEDSGPYGIYMLFPDGAFSGKMAYGAVEWGWKGINPSAGTYYCYYVDASQPTFSWVSHHRGCSTNNKADGSHIFYGDYMNGGIFSDILSDWFQTSLITTSVYMNWSGSGGFKTADINYSNSVFDSNINSCININNASSDASSINFRGGACNTVYPSAPAYGVEAHNSVGVNITDMEFGQVGNTAVAYFDNCSYCSFRGNHIWLNSSNGGAVKVNASSSSLFTNNDIRGGNSSSTLMSFLGSSSNVVTGNVLNGTASVGMAFDATSNNNLASNLNKFISGSITTPISDSGSGNSFSASQSTNLAGGATGSLPYQSAANTTAFVASPTTNGHAFVPAWQPTGGAIAPTAVDLGTYLGTNVTGTTPIVATPTTLGVTLSCPTCGTGSGGSNVSLNGGSTLSNVNINDSTPAAPSGSTNVKWQVSGSNVSGYVPAVAPVTATASSSSALTFTSCMTSAFDNYQITFTGLTPATDGAKLLIRFSTNGGTSYDSTAGIYDWSAFATFFNGSGANGSNSDTSIGIANQVSNSSSQGGYSGILFISNVNSATNWKKVTGIADSRPTAASTNDVGWSVAGSYHNSSAAVNAFEVLASSGNLASGSVTCQPMLK